MVQVPSHYDRFDSDSGKTHFGAREEAAGTDRLAYYHRMFEDYEWLLETSTHREVFR